MTIVKTAKRPVIAAKNNGQTIETVISNFGDKHESVHNVCVRYV